VAPDSVTLPPSVAVTATSVAESSSLTELGAAVSVIAVGAVSSSVSVISALVTVKPLAAPVTSIVSSPSEMLSCVGVSMNVPVPVDSVAAMVSVMSATAV
jgi:hypothetical protein